METLAVITNDPVEIYLVEVKKAGPVKRMYRNRLKNNNMGGGGLWWIQKKYNDGKEIKYKSYENRDIEFLRRVLKSEFGGEAKIYTAKDLPERPKQVKVSVSSEFKDLVVRVIKALESGKWKRSSLADILDEFRL